MAANRRPVYNRKRNYNQPYIYGNNVRKAEVYPQRHTNQEDYRPKKVSRQVRKNRKNALHMNAGYVVFLTAAALIALVVCVNYLKLQSELTRNSKKITALQRELADKKEKNNTRLNNAQSSINLEEVRKKAVESMGMTHAKPEQTIEYRNPAGSYVRRYQNIPKNGFSRPTEDLK